VLLTETSAVTASRRSARRDPGRFTVWRRQRPFIGGLLVVVAGIEMFFSGQLDIGHLHVQLGIEGMQATLIPIALVLLGILAVTMPAHHVFYGVLSLAVGLYALIGVNLGGFLIGTILACIGGVLVVAWMTPEAKAAATTRRAARQEAAEGSAE
jgi:uncharacterized membrane protein